jgi:hypothetical protein
MTSMTEGMVKQDRLGRVRTKREQREAMLDEGKSRGATMVIHLSCGARMEVKRKGSVNKS